jgi:hypothetical protein
MVLKMDYKYCGGRGLDSSGSQQIPEAGSSQYGNQPTSYVTFHAQILKKIYALYGVTI